MGWLGRLLGRPDPARQDVAELLTTYSLFRTTTETAELGDRETVRRWLRELDPDLQQQVHIRRPWGVIAAVSDHRDPVGVVMQEPDGRAWGAYVPGADRREHLTPEQVEDVMLAALTSTGRPDGPDWRPIA
ncbi:hypothetical protein ACFFMM_23095 [Micromonospora chaiyaphumensis]|uniref:Uncharacterized protein n=1 Tax=Micromonospora chaiyaphumensis TaxID=307119 RepID=A0A1C4Y813_9ACTN|nr:hypothetical protein [Micromonospora chaiyaphumensis]SCF16855.1 hypothetical protein GA0070214_107273 [Micromonospora chaiyaphumensis]